EVSEVVVRIKIGDRPAKVPQEPLADFLALDDSPGNHGEVRKHVVTAAFLELLPELWSPVLASDFIAVDKRVVEHLAGKRTDFFDDLCHHAVPVDVQRFSAKFVDLKAVAL